LRERRIAYGMKNYFQEFVVKSYTEEIIINAYRVNSAYLHKPPIPQSLAASWER
jgi:hypothetical protein